MLYHKHRCLFCLYCVYRFVLSDKNRIFASCYAVFSADGHDFELSFELVLAKRASRKAQKQTKHTKNMLKQVIFPSFS